MSIHRPEPPILNPVSGTTINTSPEVLGLREDRPVLRDNALASSETKDPSSSSKNIVIRTVEQAAAKLSASASASLGRRTSESKGRNRRSSDPKNVRYHQRWLCTGGKWVVPQDEHPHPTINLRVLKWREDGTPSYVLRDSRTTELTKAAAKVVAEAVSIRGPSK